MLKKILAIFTTFVFVGFLAITYRHYHLTNDPVRSVRHLLSEKFVQDCSNAISSNDFLYDYYATRSSINFLLGATNSIDNKLDAIPATITLKQFLEIKHLLIGKGVRQTLPLSPGTMSVWPINRNYEEWEYEFGHEDFNFNCRAMIRLEFGMPLTEDFDFTITRTSKKD